MGVWALFDGIGGGVFRRARDLRCIGNAYPQVVHLGDITLLCMHTWSQ